MRRLLLLRHAKAEPAGDGPDFDRALAERGRRNARSLGSFIAKESLTPSLAAISPARRTIETWERMETEFSRPCEATVDHRLYGASEAGILSAIHAMPAKHKSAMIVGHNPGLERLALTLAGSGGKREMREMHEKFPTCALAVIDFDVRSWKDVAPEGGMLKLFVTPATLAEN